MPHPLLNPPHPEQDIPTRFREVARCLPDHPAVLDESGATTYAALDGRSDRLAAQLVVRFGLDAEPVALLLPHTALAAAGILGVLKAGKFYVPLDPLTETGAQRTTLHGSAARILLTTTDFLSIAGSIAQPETHILTIDTSDCAPDAAPPRLTIGASACASLTFTSGITGQPKGVIWRHGGWLNRCRQSVQYDHIGPADRVNQSFSPAFALYSTITLITLLNGATLCFHSPGVLGLVELFSWLNDRAITLFFAPVSLIRDLLASNRALPRLPTVRAILLGGQTFLYRDLVGLPDLVSPDCVITNRLSMSELQLVTRYVIDLQGIKPSADPVPVGFACEGNEVMIWDADGNPAPPGEVGQIVARSRFLAAGYWNEPELTAAKFLPDPDGGDRRTLLTGDLGRMRPDGCLEYLGRKDLMVKIRGYRVEPEAIESALLKQASIQECVVAARPGRDGQARLIAYYVAASQPAPTISELRGWLAQSLPAYMIPARFVLLERLPRNANGKIDRQALPPPGHARPEFDVPFVAPRSELERQLADLWAELLELDEVGIEDNFFDLGGDSLLAMNLALHIEQRYGQPLAPTFFANPTIADLARQLASETTPAPAAHTVQARNILPRSKRPKRGAAHPVAAVARRLQRAAAGQWTLTDTAQDLRRAVGWMTLRLPYPLGIKWLWWWDSRPYVITRLYAHEQTIFHRWCAGLDAHVDEQAFSCFLMGNLLHQIFARSLRRGRLHYGSFLAAARASRLPFWRSLARLIDQSPPEQIARYFDMAGLEHLEAAYRLGCGVILLGYHTPMAIFSALLTLPRRLGCPPISTISEPAALNREKWRCRTAGMPDSDLDSKPPLAALVIQTRQALAQGQIIQILPDWRKEPENGLPVVWGGQRHRIKPGFAELALTTGAAVVPAYATLLPGGCIQTRFLPPLDSGASDQERAARIAHLARQYGLFVEQGWRQSPEAKFLNSIRDYLAAIE